MDARQGRGQKSKHTHTAVGGEKDTLSVYIWHSGRIGRVCTMHISMVPVYALSPRKRKERKSY